VTDTDGIVDLPAGLRVEAVSFGRLRAFLLKLPPGFPRWLLQHLVGNLAVARTVWRLVRQQNRQHDVIHSHGNLSTIILSLFVRRPLVYTEHDATPWLCRYRRWWERSTRKVVYRVLNVTACQRATTVVTNFEGLADELVSRWNIPRSRLVSIQNGIDADAFAAPSAHLEHASEKLPFDRYCLFVGSLEPRKSPDLLLRALVDITELCCVFVGGGVLSARLQRAAERSGLSARVHFTGPLPPSEVARFYRDADFLVLPSVSEGSPLVVLEAMARGTPVIASRIAGIPALIDDWKTGFLVKPGDLGQLSMALRFLAGDAVLRQRMSGICRKRVQTFVWPEVTRHYLQLYASLAATGDTGGRRVAPLAYTAEPILPAVIRLPTEAAVGGCTD